MISQTCLILPGAIPRPSRALGLGLGAERAAFPVAASRRGADADEPEEPTTIVPTTARAAHAATTLANLILRLPARTLDPGGLSLDRSVAQARRSGRRGCDAT